VGELIGWVSGLLGIIQASLLAVKWFRRRRAGAAHDTPPAVHEPPRTPGHSLPANAIEPPGKVFFARRLLLIAATLQFGAIGPIIGAYVHAQADPELSEAQGYGLLLAVMIAGSLMLTAGLLWCALKVPTGRWPVRIGLWAVPAIALGCNFYIGSFIGALFNKDAAVDRQVMTITLTVVYFLIGTVGMWWAAVLSVSGEARSFFHTR